ncbi:MAG: PH domain-containing protein [Pedobacter sp.]|nr:MAG: PH domain-containing protein [Pedobacter sp.]
MENFTNETIQIDQLPKYEDVALNALDPSYWKIIVINILLTTAILIAIAIGFFFLKEETKYYLLYVSLGISIFTALLFVLFRLSFKRRGIAVREKDIIYSSGVLSSKTTVIPFNRIQHVALNEGIFSRMYKLGSLEVYTAGGASGHVKIYGLAIDDANKIKELLSKRLNNAN